MIHPYKKIPNWNMELAYKRAITCYSFLAAHGLMTDGEKQKIKKRIEKWVRKEVPDGKT